MIKLTPITILLSILLKSSFPFVPQIRPRYHQTTLLQIATENSLWHETHELADPELPTLIRPHFPILSSTFDDLDEEESKPLIYLDSAATSQKPTKVTDALTNYYLHVNSNVHRGAHALSRKSTELYEGARDTIQKFINAKSRNEVIFTSGATEAINLLAFSYSKTDFFQTGDEVILSVMEHHSNIVPWQLIAKEKGIVLKYVPVKHGALDLNVLESMITDKTKLVTLQHVSNVMGCINPVSNIVDMVRSKRGEECKILLDACQSVPHMPVDVQELNVDFLAASGHKMCGPTGIGFLWGKEELLNDMPPFMGGGEMIDTVTKEGSTFAKAPARFEAGTPPIAQAIGMAAAAEYLMDIGMDRIYKYEKELASYLFRRMNELEGVTILGPQDPDQRSALAAFVCEGVHPSDLSTFLDMEGVAIRAGHHCCQILHQELGYSHSARASLYFYNTKEEVDTFVKELEQTISFLRSME